MSKGMFTQLMEAAQGERRPRRTQQAQPQAVPKQTKPPSDDLLPGRLEDLSEVGYNSHSYRFTESEIRWMRRFCLRASERLDRKISHNTLVRLLLRLADQEWTRDPDKNRLLDLLSRVSD